MLTFPVTNHRPATLGSPTPSVTCRTKAMVSWSAKPRDSPSSLVGGWTNPSETYACQKWKSSPSRGEHNKYLKPPGSLLVNDANIHMSTIWTSMNVGTPWHVSWHCSRPLCHGPKSNRMPVDYYYYHHHHHQHHHHHHQHHHQHQHHHHHYHHHHHHHHD